MVYDREVRAAAEDLLRQNRVLTEKKLADVVSEYADDFVGVLNSSRQFVVVNKNYFPEGASVESFFGSRPGEVFGCIHADESEFGCGCSEACRFCGAVNTVIEALETGRRVTRDGRLMVENNGFSSMNIRVTAIPVEIETEVFVLLFIKDTSGEAHVQLLEKTFFHDVLNSSVSLQSLIALSEVSSQAIPEADKTIQRSVRDIVDQIQYFQKLKMAENNELIVEKREVDLNEEILAVAAWVEAAAYSDGKHLRLVLPEDSVFIYTDEVLFRRIILNLVKNAMEASRQGDEVGILLSQKDETCRIEVRNPAVMSPEVKAQIFQRSFSTKGSGRGIGTYSIKILGERYLGGKVDFSSGKPGGTVFSLELPLYNS